MFLLCLFGSKFWSRRCIYEFYTGIFRNHFFNEALFIQVLNKICCPKTVCYVINCFFLTDIFNYVWKYKGCVYQRSDSHSVTLMPQILFWNRLCETWLEITGRPINQTVYSRNINHIPVTLKMKVLWFSRKTTQNLLLQIE